MENIIEEAKSLAAGGIKELIVVAQDTTRYGIDLYGKTAGIIGTGKKRILVSNSAVVILFGLIVTA